MILQSQARKESIKSAKAAIMSRNMSHNLGSHVMAYLKQHLNSVQDIVSNNILSQLIPYDKDVSSRDELVKLVNEQAQLIANKGSETKGEGGDLELALPFLVGLGRFISYLQERQDFIATIATDYVPYYAGVNFKDFIYDELNPDLRHERHKDRMGVSPDNILLGNIARSEGLARSTSPTKSKEGDLYDIVLSFRGFDGHDTQSIQDAVAKDNANRDLNDMRKFVFSLPGGVVGRQALFSIVENVIRNAAKHGNWKESKNKNLELKFEIYGKEDFSLSVENGALEQDVKRADAFRGVYDKYYRDAIDIDDLYIVTITDNLIIDSSVAGKAINKLRDAIVEPYITESGEMTNSNKGIKEMRISASWLRSLEDVVTNHPYYKKSSTQSTNENDEYQYDWTATDKRAPIILADIVPDPEGDGKSGSLRYIFCVMRQKKVAVITSDSTIANKIQDKSWSVFTLDKYKEPQTNKSFEFIIFDTTTYGRGDAAKKRADFEELRRISPNRIYMSEECIFDDPNDTEDVAADIIKRIKSERKDINALCNNIYIYLHSKLAEFDGGEKITISDNKTFVQYLKEEASPVYRDRIEILDGQKGFDRYIYKTHFETRANFNSFMDGERSACRFVEGITGNNSTDRLIRNDQLDVCWAHRHLHAAKSKVAIFDERLFSKIFKLDESDIYPKSYPTANLDYCEIGECVEGVSLCDHLYDECKRIKEKYAKDLSWSVNGSDADESELGKLDVLMDEYFDGCEDAQLLQLFIDENINGVISHAKKMQEEEPTRKHEADYMSIAYTIKGVGIFSVIKGTDSLIIYGYCGHKKVAGSENYVGLCTPIGSISLNKSARGAANRYIVENNMKDYIDESNDASMRYDYISIHQGLLDKIYDMLKIKDDAVEKYEFLKAFYAAFTTKDVKRDVIEYSDELVIRDKKQRIDKCYFLPQMYIHSGRSKPAPIDMPQKQPFIQYAAIEHAVMDCKYSLVELFDFARYE